MQSTNKIAFYLIVCVTMLCAVKWGPCVCASISCTCKTIENVYSTALHFRSFRSHLRKRVFHIAVLDLYKMKTRGMACLKSMSTLRMEKDSSKTFCVLVNWSLLYKQNDRLKIIANICRSLSIL